MSVSALRPAYKRVLLKISGESFCREGESGISMTELTSVAEQIRDVVKDGVQLAIVCGGGNILRGKQFADISEQIVPSTAHYMGMLATVINGLALQDALESVGVATRLQSAIRMEGVADHSSVVVVCVTWKKAVSSFWQPAREVLLSPPTPPLHCEPAKLMQTLY